MSSKLTALQRELMTAAQRREDRPWAIHSEAAGLTAAESRCALSPRCESSVS
jgi:hypothetical protein